MDGGASFSSIIQGGSILSAYSVVRLSNGALVLASYDALYYSQDQGATWNRASLDASVTKLGHLGRITLAASSSSASMVWGLAQAGAEGTITGVLKSMDGGRSWSFVADNSNVLFNSWVDGAMNDGGQANYDEMIAVDPKDANTVFVAANLSVYRTTNGGATWTALTDFMGHGRVYAHPDFHAAAWSQAPGAPKTLYLGNDGGLCIVRDPNRVTIPMGTGPVASDTSFVDNRRNKGLATFLAYSLGSTYASYPEDARYRISMGTQDNGTRIRRGFLPTSGTFDYFTGGDASSTLIHPLDGNLILMSEHSTAIVKSLDGGATADDSATFNVAAPDSFDYFIPIAQGSGDPSGNTVYTCGSQKIYKSLDFGSTWTPLPGNGVDPLSHGGLKTINAAKSDPNALAVLMYDNTAYVTYNGGSTWNPMAMPSSGLIGSYVWFDTANAQVIYLASVVYDPNSTHLWKSADGGHSWKALDRKADGTENGFPVGVGVHIVQNDPSDPQALYAGTDFGVYRSLDGGLSWGRFGTGLPLVSVQDMWIAPDGSFMRVATFGRGVWEFQIKEPQIALAPAAATLEVGATRAFTATLTGRIGTGVSWAASGGAFSANTGGRATYTAPASMGSFIVTASSPEDPSKIATATITVTPKIGVSPASATLEIHGTQALTATVMGTTNTAVTWTATGGTLGAATGGTVTYTAPAIAGTYTVTATSQADPTKKASVSLTVTPRITLSPAAVTLEINRTQAFTATVTGTANTAVSWTATGGTLSATTGGTVNYTAPAIAGTYTVTATSQADPTKKATSMVTATPFRLGETESNNSIATANVVPLGNGTVSGAVSSMSDFDYFAVTVAPGRVLTVSTADDIQMSLQSYAGVGLGTVTGGGTLTYANNGSASVTIYLRLAGYWDAESTRIDGGGTIKIPVYGPYSVNLQR